MIIIFSYYDYYNLKIFIINYYSMYYIIHKQIYKLIF